MRGNLEQSQRDLTMMKVRKGGTKGAAYFSVWSCFNFSLFSERLMKEEKTAGEREGEEEKGYCGFSQIQK